LPTLLYAVAQDNNHATSEAAALWIAGHWLAQHGWDDVLARRARQRGRDGLENRIRRLVLDDGSFSQHSCNYHRLMLDAVNLAEIWRRWYGLPAFSLAVQRKMAAASHWLAVMVDPVSGDVPNLGPNDGAQLLRILGEPYRDFRPCVALSHALWGGGRSFVGQESLFAWLQLPPPEIQPDFARELFAPQGGYITQSCGLAWWMLRLPVYRFRPQHCDALHFELWLHGRAVLGDSGTYSYNCEAHWQHYFASTSAHNTARLDGQEQMPRLSRFLLGEWLRASQLQHDPQHSFAAYRTAAGRGHRRSIRRIAQNAVLIEDEFAGCQQQTEVFWQLDTEFDWRLEGQTLRRSDVSLSWSAGEAELIEGQQSLFYAEKTTRPVLCVRLPAAVRQLQTRIEWAESDIPA
jgi:hypothetical protein